MFPGLQVHELTLLRQEVHFLLPDPFSFKWIQNLQQRSSNS